MVGALTPFAFGYGPAIDARLGYYDGPEPNFPYELGAILIQYNTTIRPVVETRVAVNEVLTRKGYTVEVEGVLDDIEAIYLGVAVDPLLIMKELINIPGVALVQPNFFYTTADVPPPPPLNVKIIRQVKTRYNEAWCQGNFDLIDGILIEESGLDFFDYSFARNLADIYAEEIPETAEHIRTNKFSLRSIAIKFLEIYFQESEKKTLDEIIELFRQSVKTGNVSIERRIYSPYYVTTDYWEQLVTDHLNK